MNLLVSKTGSPFVNYAVIQFKNAGSAKSAVDALQNTFFYRCSWCVLENCAED